tara:strand:+ start:117 stop:806 length:690 start_codon:yes stop_codon:yes gene_type:complete
MKDASELKEYRHKIAFHMIMEDFFSLNESKVIPEVLELIKNREFNTNPEEFKKSLMKSKHQKMLTDYNVDQLKKMKLYKLKGYDIGFALKKKDGKFQELVAVHNNEPDVRNIGDHIVQYAIKQGAVYLDHFSGKLDDFYSRNGFVEYDRDTYDPKYDPNGSFKELYDEADVVYRKLERKLNKKDLEKSGVSDIDASILGDLGLLENKILDFNRWKSINESTRWHGKKEE